MLRNPSQNSRPLLAHPTFVDDTPLPITPTFGEFVKRVNSDNYVYGGGVDTLSSRQVYLRSYKFSRKKERVSDKAIKCLTRAKESVVRATNGSINLNNLKANNNRILRRAKVVSFASFFSSLHKLVLSCSSKVNAASP